MSENREKRIFQISAALLVLGFVFGAGLYSGVTRNAVYKAIYGAKTAITTVFAERETVLATEPVHFIQPARHDGSGVTVNEIPEDGSLVLISGFFDGNPGLRLIERDGTVRRQWATPHSRFFSDTSFIESPPATDWNIDIHGQEILPDGSVVFNFEYGGTVKLGRCDDVQWVLEHPTHHSLELSETGGYWIPGRNYIEAGVDKRFPPFTDLRGFDVIYEDLILKVGPDGRILKQKSIPELLYENGYEAVLTANGENFTRKPGGLWKEILHANQISELPAALADAFPDFEAGDLMVSLRDYNMIFVVDPDTWVVKLLQIGPWLRQHDPEFSPDGTISVFNNNIYINALGPRMRARADVPEVSNIMRFDPVTRETEIVYGQRPGQEFVTVVRGKHDLVPGGGFVISEHEAGRVFQVDAQGRTVWEYVNRYDENRVLEIIEGRLYPASYFTVEDWTCS